MVGRPERSGDENGNIGRSYVQRRDAGDKICRTVAGQTGMDLSEVRMALNRTAVVRHEGFSRVRPAGNNVCVAELCKSRRRELKNDEKKRDDLPEFHMMEIMIGESGTKVKMRTIIG